jgi:hypothetical protein
MEATDCPQSLVVVVVAKSPVSPVVPFSASQRVGTTGNISVLGWGIFFCVKKRWIEEIVVAQALRLLADNGILEKITNQVLDLQGFERYYFFAAGGCHART